MAAMSRSIILIKTDFPEPVPPAINVCGSLSMLRGSRYRIVPSSSFNPKINLVLVPSLFLSNFLSFHKFHMGTASRFSLSMNILNSPFAASVKPIFRLRVIKIFSFKFSMTFSPNSELPLKTTKQPFGVGTCFNSVTERPFSAKAIRKVLAASSAHLILPSENLNG